MRDEDLKPNGNDEKEVYVYTESISMKLSSEFYVISSLIFLAFVFLIYEIKQFPLENMLYDINSMKYKNEILRIVNSDLEKQIEELKTDRGIEKLAREKLRLVKPDEIVIRSVKKK